MYNFCTLFDSGYLLRGLALHSSLMKHLSDFHLYIFPFDETSQQILIQLNLKNVIIVPLSEFESPELLKVKPSRSQVEYCWTSTPLIIEYCLEHYNLTECTYIDADLFFFASPIPLLEEMGEKSSLIISHRYTPEYNQDTTSGKYCVQFMNFKNTISGRNILKWWRDACLDWCFARFEDGKFGDQKYLDDWTDRFDGVHELNHLGGGVAPWNVQQYLFSQEDGNIFGRLKTTGEKFPLIFYHFHAIKFYDNGLTDLGIYKLSKEVIALIYKPYFREISLQESVLRSKNLFIESKPRERTPKKSLMNILRNFKRRIKNNYNIYPNMVLKNG